MKERTVRRYNAPVRRAQAEKTRAAILGAARKLFARRGYQQTTLQAIARQAKVALPTVYAVFGSKAAILSAIVKSAGADKDIREMARVAFAAEGPHRRLALAAHVIRSIHERERDIENLLWQAGGGDPDLAAVWRQSHAQQLARQGELIAPLGEINALKKGVTAETATDIHWALSSPEVYRLLVHERGWTPDRYENWLASTAAALLLRE